MGTTTKTLYDTDFFVWASHTAELIRERRFDEIDLENLAEEVEDLGNSVRKGVRSQMMRILMHLVKLRIQPERAGKSWRTSVVEGQEEIAFDLEASPSLRRDLQENLQKIYRRAVRAALRETGLTKRARELDIPEECPYTLDALLDGELEDLFPTR